MHVNRAFFVTINAKLHKKIRLKKLTPERTSLMLNNFKVNQESKKGALRTSELHTAF